MNQPQPSLQDLYKAFAATKLEPEIPESVVEAYAAGRATEVERDLIETMIEVDPSLNEVISLIREELARVNEPLPAAPKVESKLKEAWGLSRWFSLAAAGMFVSACGLFVFAQVEHSSDASDLQSSKAQFAVAERDARAQIKSIEEHLRDSNTNNQQLVAELDRAQSQLNELKLQQKNAQSSTNPFVALVGSAINEGVKVPAFISDSPDTRGGGGDLNLKMSPNQTAVLGTVRLSWTGAPTGDFKVEVTSNGERVWQANVAQSQVVVPSEKLTPNTAYSWRVVSGSKQSNWAAFRTCTAFEARCADQVLKDPSLGPREKGVVFAEIGLVPEAKAQFQLLKRSDPSLAKRLINQLDKSPK